MFYLFHLLSSLHNCHGAACFNIIQFYVAARRFNNLTELHALINKSIRYVCTLLGWKQTRATSLNS